nr:hypothetical protein [Streptomyces sp. 8P21H-1]
MARELVEAEARVTELATARKVIESITPADTDTDVDTESATAYQRILTSFNNHPGQAVRARELHEHLDLPTDEASVNVTRARLGRLLRQDHLTQPGRGLYEKRT